HYDRSAEFRELINASTSLLVAVMGQTAGCNRLHPLAQRLARWLLTLGDVAPGRRIAITHEMAANAMGSRRPTVTMALGDLARDGLIELQHRGIYIIDRRRFERAACECYGRIQQFLATYQNNRTAKASSRAS